MVALVNTTWNQQALTVKTLSMKRSWRDLFLVKFFDSNGPIFDIDDLNLIDNLRDSNLKKLDTAKEDNFIFI